MLLSESLMLTPPVLARRWGIKASKVITFIRSGELKACDLSTHAGVDRPRYKIDPVDVAAFENRRTVVPATKPAKRRKKQQTGITEYF